ncbi:hypothetical protein D9M70_361620 [compost metagenome]
MPFQEITRAMFSAPTRPTPQLMEPVPTRPWPMPSSTRPPSSRQRLARGNWARLVESSVNTPERPQQAMPYMTARLAPRRSARLPDMGRESRVERYWVLMTMPAITEP